MKVWTVEFNRPSLTRLGESKKPGFILAENILIVIEKAVRREKIDATEIIKVELIGEVE